MAKKTITVDDVDGKPADVTVKFSLEGNSYTLDLTHANEAKLRRALEPWIAAATGERTIAEKHLPKTTAQVDQSQLAQIKVWAANKGRQSLREIAQEAGLDVTVSDRGKIANDTLTALWNAAHPVKGEADEKLFSAV